MYPSGGATSEAESLIHQTNYTQPALFALEYALAELWRSWDVMPDIVLGHSVGEYAAACVAGCFALEDGLALIAERARLMQGVRRPGKMAVVFASQERVEQAIAAANGTVVIAVINGLENIVISGDAEAVDQVAGKLTAHGVQVKPLNVSHAFHSPLMDEMLEEFERFASRISYQAPRVPIAANLTGQLLSEAPTARYWRDHLRNTVQFAEGVARVHEGDAKILIELGPTASLLGMARRCAPDWDAAWLPSLREGQNDWQVLASSVAEYYVRGGQVDWRGWDQPWERHRLLLPNYPFQRSRHWYPIEQSRRRLFADGGDRAGDIGGFSVAEIDTPDTTKPHPLLGKRLSTVWSNSLFETRLRARSPAYLVDHQVQGSVVMPAAAYVEQALAAADAMFGPGRHGLENVVIQQAMFLPEGARRRVETSVAPESGGESTFEIYSRATDAETFSAWAMHAAGSVVHEDKLFQAGELKVEASVMQIDLETARRSASSVTSRQDFYQLMADRGLAYGPAFQVLDDLRRGGGHAVARIVLPDSVIGEADRYTLHPALGDALLQAMAGVVPLEDDGSFSPYSYMPVGIRRVIVRSTIDSSAPLFAYALRSSGGDQPSPERIEGDVSLVDESGNVLASFEGVQVQRLGRSGAGGGQAEIDINRWLYRVEWRHAPLSEPTSEASTQQGANRDPATNVEAKSGAWLIFADAEGNAAKLGEQLLSVGQASVLVRPGSSLKIACGESGNGKPGLHAAAEIDPLNGQHYQELIDKLFVSPKRRCQGILHLWSLDITEPRDVSRNTARSDREADSWRDARRLGCGGAAQLVRAVSRASFPTAPQLWLVTAGSQFVDSEEGRNAPIAASQSALWGLGRVAALELPELKTRLVDLDPAAVAWNTDSAAAKLFAELLADSSESQIAYRGEERFVARLVRVTALTAESANDSANLLSVPADESHQLRITRSGSLDALRFVPVAREMPTAGQVEIEIRAAGLNFSDVLKALGLYPGIKDAIVPLGIEASGVVTAVGEGVDRFRVGDEVFGVVPYAFASHARTAEYALMHKPASIAHEEACTIPITFLTAYYGLVHLARLAPGERVLIHAAAGGVGLAAIQIAKLIGAEVFATAGSEEKRNFLKSLDIERVYSSRSTAFAEQILAHTNREGVDVVLNSLPGEAITKSLSVLRAYGRFLEIGKTDIYQNRMIGLLPFQDNLSYFAIDLDRMLRQRPDYIRELFAEVMKRFTQGHYQPLTFTRFTAEQTIDAFRYMSQRKNIGKVVVSMEGRASRVEGRGPDASISDERTVRRDGMYLISGGLGALGLRVADWLAEQGAGAIAVMSRRRPDQQAQASLDAIRAKGAAVIVLTGDVADADSLAATLKQLPKDAPPIRGVVHAAGVLADGILRDMTLEQLDAALAPKMRGAWNLHAATLDQPLDFFVMFSSVASVLGSPGQANYTAGNAYLDALAQARRAQGLPALSINWGPWGGSGMAVEHGRDEAVRSRGMALLDPDRALSLLSRLLKQSSAANVAILDANWGDVLRLYGSRRPALLEQIAAESQQASAASTSSRVDQRFRQELLAADDSTRRTLVRDYIRQELGRIIGIEPANLDARQPLSTFGLDSLLALELKNNLESRLDFTLPMAKLMEGPSIESLAEETVRLVAGSAPASQSEKPAEEWVPLLALRSTGTRPPLVVLPALGGDIRCYADLVQELGDDQPVYAFRPRGADQDLPPHESISEMIADYKRAVQELQPTGPYYLAGWSTGGIYAFALASALEQAGCDVAMVALFDTPLPSICDNIDLSDDAKFLCDLMNYASRFSGADVRFNYEELSAIAADERFAAILAKGREQGVVPAETPESFIRRLVKVGEANVRVIQGYVPRAIKAPVHLFRPTIKGGLAEVSGRDMSEEDELGWNSEVGLSVELHELGGDHFTMMIDNNAKQLAGQLRSIMNDLASAQTLQASTTAK